jgi:hypothetical protein
MRDTGVSKRSRTGDIRLTFGGPVPLHCPSLYSRLIGGFIFRAAAVPWKIVRALMSQK